MKIKFIYAALLLIFSCMLACKESAPNPDILFFTGTEQSPEVKLTLDGPGSIGLTVTSSTKVNRNVSVNLNLRQDLLDTYNQKTGKSYALPPEGSYSLSANNVIIQNGTHVSESAKLSVTSTDKFEEGVTYCLPISITGTDSGIGVLEPSRTIYIVINRTIITKAANISNSNYFTIPSFATDPTLTSIGELTMECRVYVNAFQSANPFISSVMGIEENFLLRFGDVSIQRNQLQLAGGLVDNKKFPVTSTTLFSTGKWYHVAVVYNGSSNTIYVDGKRDGTTEAAKGSITFTGPNGTYMGGFHVGFSERGRYLNGYVSEARVWTRALTPNELQNNLCYVDPTTKGLLAYWRFNGAESGVNVTDLTGHGHTAVAAKTINYVEGVRCPE